MNTDNSHITKRRPDPFDGSAPARLAHMGLLRKDGSPETGAMAVFIRIFAGSFFDEICDFYDNPQQIKAVLSAFSELPSGSSCFCPYNMIPCENPCRNLSGGWRETWSC